MDMFHRLFIRPREEMKKVITENIANNLKILDIGCDTGFLEEELNLQSKGCFVYCVENNREAIKTLKRLKFANLDLEIKQQKITNFLRKNDLQDFDAILSNMVLHEIWDKNQEKYFDFFFKSVKRILREDGIVVLGDYYYPKHLSEEEVKEYIKYQKKEIGHADLRKTFVFPELILTKAQENGFKVKYFKEIRSNKRIDRRFYSIVLQKTES